LGDRRIYVADTANNRVQVFDPVPDGPEDKTPFNLRSVLGPELSLNQPNSCAAVSNLLSEEIWIADTGNNRVILVQIPNDNPLPTWNSMLARMAAGDIAGAVTNFSFTTAQGYQAAFLTVGIANSTSDISRIGTLTPVYIRNDEAEYYFEQTVQGILLLFPVKFVREHGVWKILEF
jgi:hypothetical protein